MYKIIILLILFEQGAELLLKYISWKIVLKRNITFIDNDDIFYDKNICKNNNCYNYASGILTGTYSQPGWLVPSLLYFFFRITAKIYPSSQKYILPLKLKLDGFREVNDKYIPKYDEALIFVKYNTKDCDYHCYKYRESNVWYHKLGQLYPYNNKCISNPHKTVYDDYHNLGYFCAKKNNLLIY